VTHGRYPGVPGGAVVADAQTGRVFVADSDEGTVAVLDAARL